MLVLSIDKGSVVVIERGLVAVHVLDATIQDNGKIKARLGIIAPRSMRISRGQTPLPQDSLPTTRLRDIILRTVVDWDGSDIDELLSVLRIVYDEERSRIDQECNQTKTGS